MLAPGWFPAPAALRWLLSPAPPGRAGALLLPGFAIGNSRVRGWIPAALALLQGWGCWQWEPDLEDRSGEKENDFSFPLVR